MMGLKVLPKFQLAYTHSNAHTISRLPGFIWPRLIGSIKASSIHKVLAPEWGLYIPVLVPLFLQLRLQQRLICHLFIGPSFVLIRLLRSVLGKELWCYLILCSFRKYDQDEQIRITKLSLRSYALRCGQQGVGILSYKRTCKERQRETTRVLREQRVVVTRQ